MKKNIYILLVLTAFVLGACNPQGTGTPPPDSPCWWDQPPSNTSYASLDPLHLMFHCASFAGIESIQLNINGTTAEEVLPSQTGSGGAEYGTLFLGEYDWTPPAFGTYLLEVRGKKSGAGYGPPAHIQIVFTDGLAELPTLESPPTPTDTPAPTEEPEDCDPEVKALLDLNCRLGPGTGFENVGTLLEGESTLVDGQNSAGTWVWILNPDALGHCWVWREGVEEICMPERLDIIAEPTLEPESTCQSDMDRTACGAAGGRYDVSVDPPECKCP